MFHGIESFDFDDFQLVIVLESPLVVEAYAEQIQAIKCPVLGYLDGLASVTPRVFDQNKIESAGIFGLVQPPVAALAEVLQGCDCESVDLTVLYPASFYGRQGVSELAAQTARLLNAQALEHKVFDKQMPFNYFPMAESAVGSHLEKQLASELSGEFTDVDSHVTAIQMPVFHGVAMLVSVVLNNEVELDKLQECWDASDEIRFESSAKNLSNMDIIQLENQILVGNVRKSESDDYRFDCWIGVDDVKFSASKQLIFAADFLLKHHL